LKPVFDYQSNGRKIKYYQSRLTGDELAEFDQLNESVSQFFTLTAPPLNFTSRVIRTRPQQGIVVNFDNEAQTLQVSPVIDYGMYRQDISESIYISRREKGDILSRREPFEHPGTHIITVSDNIIYCAKINKRKEIKFYEELVSRINEFGFTKTLKCQRRGNKQISEYLNTIWPALSSYAKNKGYEITFKKDEVPIGQTFFRADFVTDMSTENDWLYFDIDCYCGSERVTLEKLLLFLKSGESFWRKEDGTLVQIANSQELEHLAQLLQSFHAREDGGFEGHIHHTPELEYIMTSSSHYNLKRSKSFEQFLSQAQEGKPIKKVQLPNRIVKILRPYQKDGIEWLYFLRSYRFAGILADDMGLGKTLQTLTVLDKEKIKGCPSLIICPKTLLYNWKEEAEKFFPSLRVLIYDGTPKERFPLQEKVWSYDLVIVSYPTLKQDGEFFSNTKARFNYAVIDEAQFIKNHATKNAQIVKKINADYRLALTGTPFENSVSEIWSIYDFLMPGFLGNYERFAKHFHKPIMEAGDRQVLEHLRRKIEPFMLRRTKSEVLKELPPKIEQLSQCHLSEAQNILYQQILIKVRSDVFETVNQKGFKKAQIHILAGLTKLRQACNHPALLIKDKDFRKYESAKLDMCLELIEEAIKSQHKVLIFSQFTQMLDIVSSVLKEKNISHLYLSGKTKNRQELTHKFNNDSSIPIFLISLKAGGTGLNLTSADTVIIFDPWWNPSVENQAIDRTHRIGQAKVVNVYRLLTSGTIEEKIQVLKEKKQQLFNALIGESGDTFKKLTWDEIKDLFTE
jgi:SNF2 family DNA or RNA helicase